MSNQANTPVIDETADETEIVVYSSKVEVDYIGSLTKESSIYCSMLPDTDEKKMLVLNAMNNPEFRIGDEIGQVIYMKDVFIETVHLPNQETGVMTATPRIVILDEKGQGHQCVSFGIYSFLQKAFTIYGKPTWEKPIPVKVRQLTRGKNKMLTLDVVSVKQ